MVSLNLPLWLRFVLVVGVVGLASGASLLAYRYHTRPVTLSVAVGSVDGEAAKAMSAIASRLVSTGIGNLATSEGPLDSLYALGRRIRNASSEAELLDIEEEIDNILKAQRAKSATGDESAVDEATLNVAAHRLESLIHDRRAMLAKRPAVASSA
jgi:hypothetical protein